MPTVRKHLTAKHYLDQSTFYTVDEIKFLRSNPDEKLKLDEQDSISPNSTLSSPKTKIEIPNKPYLIAYLKTAEIDESFCQYITIKTMNLLTII